MGGVRGESAYDMWNPRACISDNLIIMARHFTPLHCLQSGIGGSVCLQMVSVGVTITTVDHQILKNKLPEFDISSELISCS